MILQRILAFAALLAAAAACTPDGNPPQTSEAAARPVSASAVSRAGSAPAPPREIEQQVGAVTYRAPALHAYVDRVGQKLVARGGVGGSYRFFVLDQPNPNAHALPSGYVFVTRGLLALLDDEAELAAALAHELGHLTRRHSAQRARAYQGAMGAAVDAARTTGSLAIGRSVARDGLLELRRYSRDQELEADRVGLGYIRQAGYRGDAMASLIDKLNRQARLEGMYFGDTPESAERPSAASTHPAPNERLVALRGIDTGSGGETGRSAYLAAIDGLPVDDSPEEGFVRGTAFLHPTLKLAFEVSRDFRLFNDHDGVLGIGRDRSLLYFSCKPAKVSGRLADWMRDNIKPTPSDIQSTEIGGAEAAIGERPRGADTGLANFRQVLIRRPDGVCFFNLLAEGLDRDRRINTLIAAARTFRSLGDGEAASLRPYRLRVMSIDGTSPAQLAARLPYGDLRMERLLTLNGVDDAAGLVRKGVIKTVEP